MMAACAPAASTSHVATTDHGSERSGAPSGERAAIDKSGDDTDDVEVARQDPPVYSERAREVWRAAAQSSDWEEVVRRIDGLPEADRAEPGTRYVRALAARRLGDC